MSSWKEGLQWWVLTRWWRHRISAVAECHTCLWWQRSGPDKPVHSSSVSLVSAAPCTHCPLREESNPYRVNHHALEKPERRALRQIEGGRMLLCLDHEGCCRDFLQVQLWAWKTSLWRTWPWWRVRRVRGIHRVWSRVWLRRKCLQRRAWCRGEAESCSSASSVLWKYSSGIF